MKRIVVLLGEDLLTITLWDEQYATLAVADGASIERGVMAKALEAMAQYLRTGVLGELPPGVRVVKGD